MIIRSCDGCTLCCKIMPIKSVGKLPMRWCEHCNPKIGCLIYDNRYDECKNYQCLWTWAEGILGDLIQNLKPNKVHFILNFNHEKQTIEIWEDSSYLNKWKKYQTLFETIGNQIAVIVVNSSLSTGVGKIALERFGKNKNE